MMPSGHKAFLVSNVKDLELLMMHNRTYAAEYETLTPLPWMMMRLTRDTGSPTTSPPGSASTSSAVRSN